jgi:hypothetical protein
MMTIVYRILNQSKREKKDKYPPLLKITLEVQEFTLKNVLIRI